MIPAYDEFFAFTGYFNIDADKIFQGFNALQQIIHNMNRGNCSAEAVYDEISYIFGEKAVPEDLDFSKYVSIDHDALLVDLDDTNGFNIVFKADCCFAMERFAKDYHLTPIAAINKTTNIDRTPELTSEQQNTFECINRVLELQANIPAGQIQDADTILADIMRDADFEITGLAKNIFKIWQNSTDKTGIEALFYDLTDTQFSDYVAMCEKQITRGQER